MSGSVGPWLYTRGPDGVRWVDSADMPTAGGAPPSSGPRVVVGAMNDTLAVADYEKARRIASAWRALALAETIEEALDRLPEPYRSEVDELRLEAEADGEPPPDRDALHDWAMEGGIEWIEQEMLDLPEPIADLGEQSSGANGPCLLIPGSRRAELLSALEAAGYEVVEDDELAWAASPYGYDSASA